VRHLTAGRPRTDQIGTLHEPRDPKWFRGCTKRARNRLFGGQVVRLMHHLGAGRG